MTYERLLDRFIGYVKVDTQSDPGSATTPSTPSQVEFAHKLADEMRALGVRDVHYLEHNGYVVGTIPATTDRPAPKIGFIAHMDTASDFSADGVAPQIVRDYDGGVIPLGASGFALDPAEFPSLASYVGQTLITTDGTTLLGSDDKSGDAEIMTMAEHLLAHPEIEHGEIRIGFGPDEEIGTGADKFDVADFDVDFAFTVDGGPLGELQYESFSAAEAIVDFLGKAVHPGTAKGQMVNASNLAIEFHNALPAADRPEKTEGREGFWHLLALTGVVDHAQSHYIIRDHDDAEFARRKQSMLDIAAAMNAELGQERVTVTMHDQYYNMATVLKDHMHIIELAKAAMARVGVEPVITPIRGGTDGSKISFLGLPTPNLFAGGENMHSRFEYVSLQVMEQAVDVLVEIVRLNAS
ncbi:MAG: peptidase T [Actinomycetia bacterium]|nr:peptidase T [Actinomycetes bacterium]